MSTCSVCKKKLIAVTTVFGVPVCGSAACLHVAQLNAEKRAA